MSNTRESLRLRAIAGGGLVGYFIAAAFGQTATVGFVLRYVIAWALVSGVIYLVGLRFLKDK